MSERIWIKEGRVIDPASGRDEIADLCIEGRTITVIEPKAVPARLEAKEKLIDAKGCWVVPGLVDIHTHLRDPGYEYKETIASGTRSAAAGGFTSIACMANTDPVNDAISVTEYITQKARREGKCKVYPIGAVSIGLKGDKLAPFGDLKEAGCVALSDDGHPVMNSELYRHALSYARNFDLPIISHCQDNFLFAGGCMNEGLVSAELGLKGIPNACEDIAVARDIELAALTQGRLHLAHLSTSGSVRLLAQAKDRHLAVSGEVTPHHFILTDVACRGYDANTKMNPPLRTEEDRLACIAGLKNGVFDAIASDHAPHSVDEKELEFDRAPFGIIGFETTVSLTLKLVHDGFLTPLEAIRLLTIGPAKVLNLNAGTLRKAGAADVVLIDPAKIYVFDGKKTASKSMNTPFTGYEFKGKVRMTILNGEVVYGE